MLPSKNNNVLDIDNCDLEETLQLVAAYGMEHFGYLVTPNADHIIRHSQDRRFRTFYANAAYVLLDSRFIANLLGIFKRQRIRVCLGSDLTNSVFRSVIRTDDAAILVGGSASQAQQLRTMFNLTSLKHLDPPMGLIDNEAAIEECLRAIEAASPFRFCFLAIGSPQQELVAYRLKERGKARGLALCIGASINFMTGAEKRAPLLMQAWGLEWLYRLAQDPRRLARRYLVRGPRIFPLLLRSRFKLRRPTLIAAEVRAGGLGTQSAPPVSDSRSAA